jgi:dolichol kinase
MTHEHPTGTRTAPHRDASESEGGPPGSLPAADGAALSLSGELLRKGLHLLALLIPACMYVLERSSALLLLLPLAFAAVGADLLRARSPRFERFILSIFGRMMRPRERPRVGGRPVINGATWVLVAAAILTVVFPVELSAPGFAAFMVADAAAAIIGLRFGRTRWPGTHRTVEGSVTFVTVALLCLLPFDAISAPAAAASALTGAAVEAPDWAVNDNLRVPIVMVGVLLLWAL